MSHFYARLRWLLAALAVLVATSAASAQSLPVRAIQVAGNGDPIMRELAGHVAAELSRQLGTRYVPGARGGATLIVRLTDYDLPYSDGGGGFDDGPFGRRRFFGGGGPTIDLLEGTVTLLDGRRRTISSFPLTATTTAVGASVMHMRPPVYRLRGLAGVYAMWVVRKLR